MKRELTTRALADRPMGEQASVLIAHNCAGEHFIARRAKSWSGWSRLHDPATYPECCHEVTGRYMIPAPAETHPTAVAALDAYSPQAEADAEEQAEAAAIAAIVRDEDPTAMTTREAEAQFQRNKAAHRNHTEPEPIGPSGGPRLSPQTLALFLAYAADADNWSGTPLVGGNVEGSLENNARLTHMKKAGLIRTSQDGEGNAWIEFTDLGRARAREYGVEIHDRSAHQQACAEHLRNDPDAADRFSPST